MASVGTTLVCAGCGSQRMQPRHDRRGGATRHDKVKGGTGALDERVDGVLTSTQVVDIGDDKSIAQLAAELAPCLAPPTLTFSEVVVSMGERTVLGPVSGSMSGGRLIALLGPSGSGKTCLLTALSGLPGHGTTCRGSVELDGKPLPSLPLGSSSLNRQDEPLAPTLTPREALSFVAALKMSHLPAAKKHALVSSSLRDLHLLEIADTLIGDRAIGLSGVSGGERKRVGLGAMLVACPHVMLIDEPTSGLDAHTALHVVRLLSDMTTSGRLVVLSLHQPSTQIWALFADLWLLASGNLAYRGSPASSASQIQALLPNAPPQEAGVTDSDHLLCLLATLQPPSLKLLHTTAAIKGGDANGSGATPPSSHGSVGSSSGGRGSRLRRGCLVLKWCGWRSVAQLARDPAKLRTQLVVSVGMALLLGGIFYDVSADVAGFQNKSGALLFILFLVGLGGISTANTLTQDWPLLTAEWQNGVYPSAIFVSVKLAVELLTLRLLPTLALGAIFYPMMGLRHELEAFVVFLLASALASINAALLCNAIAACAPRSPGSVALVSSVLLLVLLLLSGFLINLAAMPAGLRWVADISFARYAFETMLTTELERELVSVDVPGAPKIQIKAELLLEVLGFDPNRTGVNLGILVAMSVLLWLLIVLLTALQLRMTKLVARCRIPMGGRKSAARGAPQSAPATRAEELRA
uniref:ABC transporter domain-containing protein n=1 Tax=Haptolina brevifila TaxID=156173 RepID=A0A7S2J132_9EUKA